jgi:hypothetical protein
MMDSLAGKTCRTAYAPGSFAANSPFITHTIRHRRVATRQICRIALNS